MKCTRCNCETVHRTKIRVGDLTSLSLLEKIKYNTINKNTYIDTYKCFKCGNSWTSEEYEEG